MCLVLLRNGYVNVFFEWREGKRRKGGRELHHARIIEKFQIFYQNNTSKMYDSDNGHVSENEELL